MSATLDPARLLVVGVEANCLDGLDDRVRRLLAQERVGGLILFARNLPTDRPPEETRAGLRRTIDATNAYAAEVGLPPLFWMIDHEGGRVHRLGQAATQFPPPGLLGPRGEATVRAVCGQQAAELRALGFNTILGPVLDVCPATGTASHIAARSFSGDPAQAAALGLAAIEAFTAGGILCVPKHFPGYGAAPIDPHLDLPTRTDPLADLRARDLVPFARAVGAACPAVMTAHIVATAVDPDLPCTLSAPWLSLLRDELGFGGCVVSDDLCMASVKDRYGPADLSERTLRAGLDLLLVCHPGPETIGEIRRHVRRVCESDPAFAARVSEAHRHVDAARALLTSPLPLTPELFARGAQVRADLPGATA